MNHPREGDVASRGLGDVDEPHGDPWNAREGERGAEFLRRLLPIRKHHLYLDAAHRRTAQGCVEHVERCAIVADRLEAEQLHAHVHFRRVERRDNTVEVPETRLRDVASRTEQRPDGLVAEELGRHRITERARRSRLTTGGRPVGIERRKKDAGDATRTNTQPEFVDVVE